MSLGSRASAVQLRNSLYEQSSLLEPPAYPATLAIPYNMVGTS